MKRILQDFNDIACDGIPTIKPKHRFEHHIETKGQPIRSPCRRLDPACLAAARSYFADMEAAGVVVLGDSPWASPLHIVVKGDGLLRPCGDYTAFSIR